MSVLHLEQLVSKCAALLDEGLGHCRRVEFMHLRRLKCRPARFAIAAFLHQHNASAKFQQGPGLWLLVTIGKGEQLDVELACSLAKKMEDSNRSAMRERVREIRRKHRNLRPALRALPALDHPISARTCRMVPLR